MGSSGAGRRCGAGAGDVNAAQWVMHATEGMPPGVVSRVRAETLAHLQDAEAAAEADVRPWLGHPQETRLELGRLYLTQGELSGPKGSQGMSSRTPPLWMHVVFLVVLLVLTGLHPTSMAVVGVALYIIALGCSRGLPTEFAWKWQHLGLVGAVALRAVPSALPLPLELAIGALLTLLWSLGFWKLWYHDARLRRTLALERAT